MMTDPTALILTGVFSAVFGVFWLFFTLRQPLIRNVLPPELPRGKVAIWFYRSGDLVGVGLLFGVFAWLVLGSLQHEGKEVESLNPSVLWVNIGFQFAIAGAVALWVLRRVNVVDWLGLRWPEWRWVFLIAPGAVFFMWAIFGGLQVSGYVEWMESLGVETVQDTVKLLQETENPQVLGLMIFAAVIAAPLCEEIVFRGYFYPVLKRYCGMWPAVLCSALFFGAAHGSLAAFLPLFIFGAVLVFIYEKTGSLWAPIAVHFCFNGATVLVQMAARYYQLPLEAGQ